MAHKMTTEERIAHFLRLAENAGATQEERDTASAQAERLMLKHGIDRLMLPGEKTREQIDKQSLFFGGSFAAQRMRSAYRVLVTLGLKCYKVDARDVDPISGKVVAGVRLYVAGFENDLRDGLALARSLDVQAAVAVKHWAKEQTESGAWYWKEAGDKQVARKSFLEAFGEGASKRIREAKAETIREQSDTAGTALVLVNREHEVDAWLNANTTLRSGRRSTHKHDRVGAAAGRSAGYNAATGGRGVTSGRLALAR